jgi:hypothetical protein
VRQSHPFASRTKRPLWGEIEIIGVENYRQQLLNFGRGEFVRRRRILDPRRSGIKGGSTRGAIAGAHDLSDLASPAEAGFAKAGNQSPPPIKFGGKLFAG